MPVLTFGVDKKGLFNLFTLMWLIIHAKKKLMLTAKSLSAKRTVEELGSQLPKAENLEKTAKRK